MVANNDKPPEANTPATGPTPPAAAQAASKQPETTPASAAVTAVIVRPYQHHGVDYRPAGYTVNEHGTENKWEADRIELTPGAIKALSALNLPPVVAESEYEPATHDPVMFNGEWRYWQPAKGGK